MEIFWLDAFIVIVRLNEVWKKDFRMRPIKCIFYPTCNSKNPLKHTRYTHTHKHESKGEGFVRAHKLVEGGLGVFLTSCTGIAFPVSFLPPGFGEDNDGASAAFEGCFDGTNGYRLWRVSSQLGVPPQLLKQLPVEGSRLGLSCYLSPERPRGGRGGLYFQSHQKMFFSTTTHSAGRDWHHCAAPPLVPQSNLSSFRSTILKNIDRTIWVKRPWAE